MSILTLPRTNSKLNNSTKTTPQKNKKKPRKTVQFATALTETKIIQYPTLSILDKRQLYYDVNDIQRFRQEEYCRVKYGGFHHNNNANNTEAATKNKVFTILVIIMACTHIVSYVLYNKLFKPVVSHFKDLGSLLFGQKHSFESEPCERRKVEIVFEELEYDFFDSV